MPVKNGNGTEMSLHYHHSSFYSQKVIMSLYQKKLKFRPISVDIQKGKQFTEKFLALNPRGEVPVLVDDLRVIPGSELILNYLEDNFSNGTPRLLPTDLDLRQRVEQLHEMIHSMKIEELSSGSLVHDDLELNPKPPFDNPLYRSQIKSLVENRTSVLRKEITKHPNFADSLSKKLQDIEQDSIIFRDKKKYDDLILTFEKVMDECEAEISSHDDSTWWLASPELSIADISLSILMHRCWLLGFEKKMWSRNRPHLKRYFARVQQLDSFKKATTLSQGINLLDILQSPIFWGCLGAVAIAGGGYYLWNKKGVNGEPFYGFFSTSEFDSTPTSLPSHIPRTPALAPPATSYEIPVKIPLPKMRTPTPSAGYRPAPEHSHPSPDHFPF